MVANELIPAITWLGHDAFKIVGGGKVIYIDPFQLPPSPEPADIICITHEHFDHCSPKDFEAITTPKTMTVAAAVCAPQLLNGRLIIIHTGEKQMVDGIEIEAVPAYNIDKAFHPKDDERIGFIITVEGKRVYHAGDTDHTPEMDALKNIDVALLPVSGTYVMTAEQAAEAANVMKPKLAIPMHYGSIIGGIDDAKRFAALAKVPTKILTVAK